MRVMGKREGVQGLRVLVLRGVEVVLLLDESDPHQIYITVVGTNMQQEICRGPVASYTSQIFKILKSPLLVKISYDTSWECAGLFKTAAIGSHKLLLRSPAATQNSRTMPVKLSRSGVSMALRRGGISRGVLTLKPVV